MIVASWPIVGLKIFGAPFPPLQTMVFRLGWPLKGSLEVDSLRHCAAAADYSIGANLQYSGIRHTTKLFRIKAFPPKGPIESLVAPILPGFPRLNPAPLNPLFFEKGL